MHISALYHFPVKSLQGHSCQTLALDQFGAIHDRRWMLVDSNNQFLSQRRLRKMAQLKATATDNGVRIENSAGEEIEVRQPAPGAELRRVRVWDDDVVALDAGDAAANWLGEQLQTSLRLVAMGRDFRRPLAAPRADIQVSFADAAPLLVISQESLDDLNGRLAETVSMLRFRPNLVISGAKPFAEDHWTEIVIHTNNGPLCLECTHPCARCAIPGLDPLTGKAQKEPLRTLAQYRRWQDGQIYFGQNLAPINGTSGSQIINLGDKVEVIAKPKLIPT